MARYLKERNPEIKIVGADPEGSVLSGDTPQPWKVEGIGEDFVPKTFNSQLVDEWVRVGDAESFHTARALARREGILVGGSSGTAVAAALRYARRLTGEHLVVALCADTGRNYLSKFFDDAWLAENNLLWNAQPAQSIGDLLRTRGPRPLVTISPEASAPRPSSCCSPPASRSCRCLQDGKPVGSVQEVTLARVLHDDSDPARGHSRRDHGPAAAAARHQRAPRRGLSPAAGRQHRRAGGGERQGRRYRHPHRSDPVLEQGAQALTG